MARFKQDINGKGSLKAIQTLVNDYPQVFEDKIRKSLPNLASIQWVSPLRDDDMAEYRDEAFLKRVEATDRTFSA